MAMKTNYAFERRERDRLKAEKKAKRAAEKKAATESSSETETPSEGVESSDDQDGQASN